MGRRLPISGLESVCKGGGIQPFLRLTLTSVDKDTSPKQLDVCSLYYRINES